ncbi:MAG: ABC transporter ATP-binding protein, partial [Candidatus Omnitrophica bacterium CG12_big_fil_rev_8_21_14_0_65_45_16]
TVHGQIAPLLEVGAGFHPELTGRENIFLNGVILGMSKHDIRKCFDQIVTFAELDKFIDSPVKLYSSGMYIRLGFSVAVHSNFDILLADEIFAVGDYRFRMKCLDKFGLLKKQGKTIVLISHSLEQLQKHCQRGILIRRGKIVIDAEIEQVCNQYQNMEQM